MRFTLAIMALTAVAAVKIDTEYTADPLAYKVVNNKIFKADCPLPLEKSEEEMQLQLSQFSRTFQKVNYENAMKIYGALKKQGKDPRAAVTTYELYDHAFPFEKVRRYDLVQQHMNMLEHFEDNLNENISNGQAVDNFIIVARNAQLAINTKYHDGEFADPAGVDPWNPADPTWATVKF